MSHGPTAVHDQWVKDSLGLDPAQFAGSRPAGSAGQSGAGAATTPKAGPAPGLKIADLTSNFDAADKACAEIDALIASRPNDPGVAAARKDLDAKFGVIVHAGEAGYRSLDQIYDELKKNAGLFQTPDEKKMQQIRDEYAAAIKNFSNAVRLAGGGHYRQANAELHIGHTGVRAAAIDLDGLIRVQVENAKFMIEALKTVQESCMLLLAVLSGGVEGLAAKFGIALMGAATMAAEKLSAEQLWGIHSDITLGQIGAQALLELVFMGLDKKFEVIDDELKPFLDTELKNCAPMVKVYVQNQLNKGLAGMLHSFLEKAAKQYFADHESEAATPMQFALDVLHEATVEYARDGLASTVATLIKEYGHG